MECTSINTGINKTNHAHVGILCNTINLFTRCQMSMNEGSWDGKELGQEHVVVDLIKLTSEMTDCTELKLIVLGHAQQQTDTKQWGSIT